MYQLRLLCRQSQDRHRLACRPRMARRRAVTCRPEWSRPARNCRCETLYLIEPADRDVGKHAVGITHDIDVVGDRTGVEGLQEREWRLPIEHLGLAGVFQGEPDLLAVRRCGDVGTERARLRNPADDFVIGDGDDYSLWCKRGADIAVLAVGREDRHTRTVGNGDPRLLLVRRAVEYGDVVLAADGNPHFFAIHRKERFVRRAPNISYVLYTIGRGIDEVHRIRTNCDNRDSAMIRRKPHAVHQQLALIERTEIGRQRIAKTDGANELVVDGIGDGDRVRVLFGGVDAILMADGNIGIGRGRGSLSGDGIVYTDKTCRNQQNGQCYVVSHITAPLPGSHYKISNRSSPQTGSDQATVWRAARLGQATTASQ